MAPKSAPKAAAPAPAPAEAEGEFVIDVGVQVQFLGYGPDVPEPDRFLEEGQVLTISAFGEGEEEGAIFATFENPDFNPKKKEHPDTNPKLIETQVLDTEIGPVDEEQEPEVEPEVVAPAVKGKATTKAAAKGEAAAPAPAAKGKATTKAAPAAAKGKAATKTAKKVADKAAELEEAADPDALPDLETEDATVAALVAENEGNLLSVAQELEGQAAMSEYHLGGILFHIKKSGEYLTLEKGVYDVEKGWQQFLADYFNTGYRKAQYLIEIYTAFSLAAREDAAEVVAAMGWSKAAKIARPMLDGYDADELIEAANTNTVEDLSEVVKETVSEGGTKGTKGEKVVKLTVKFRLVEDDATTADTILKAAQEQLGLKDVGEAFMVILTDWYNDHVAAGEVAETEVATQAAPKAAAKKAAGRKAQTA